MQPGPGEVTKMLKAWTGGDPAALERLAPIVQLELRRIASQYLKRERPGHTLQPTELINEAYLRLIEWQDVDWQNRTHFYAVAAKIMRRVLVTHAVARGTQKRKGGALLVTLSEAGDKSDRNAEMLALDEALIALSKIDARKSDIVELRFFGGLSAEETADVLQLSVRTVHREWEIARAWLFRELHGKSTD